MAEVSSSRLILGSVNPLIFSFPSISLFHSFVPVLLDALIERLYDLNVGVVGMVGERHERPHKPLLLFPQDQAFHPNAEGLK